MNNEKMSVRVELDSDYIEMFNEIKSSRSLTTNTEVIRYCLFELSKAHNFRLDKDHVKSITTLVNQKYVKLEYSIYSISDFIRMAINRMIQEIRENSKSIQHWDIRLDLTDEETELALALIEVQENTTGGEVTVKTLADHLNNRNPQKISSILDDFVERGILSSRIHNNKKVYHAKK